MRSPRENSMFTAQEGNVIPLTYPWMLPASRTLVWTDGCQRSPRGMANITSLQLSKCAPSSSKSELQLRNRHPANACFPDQDTSNACFVLVQSQSLLHLRPESLQKNIRILRKERKGTNHKEGTIFEDSLKPLLILYGTFPALAMYGAYSH